MCFYSVTAGYKCLFLVLQNVFTSPILFACFSPDPFITGQFVNIASPMPKGVFIGPKVPAVVSAFIRKL